VSFCEKCTITGLVQGVFYRTSTKQQAEKFGVTGYVKNMPEGHVEVLICGKPEAVGHVKAWLWDGSAQSHVSNVKCELIDDIDVPERFEIT